MLFRPPVNSLRLSYTGPAETIGQKQLFSGGARLDTNENCTLLTETALFLGPKHIFTHHGVIFNNRA